MVGVRVKVGVCVWAVLIDYIDVFSFDLTIRVSVSVNVSVSVTAGVSVSASVRVSGMVSVSGELIFDTQVFTFEYADSIVVRVVVNVRICYWVCVKAALVD